jgi:predicted RNase H-like nuclease (RuvC/YqgF family)
MVAPEEPKRKPGRPLGSTNAKKPAPASARKTAASKPAARAPKLNKAELEAQVAKLERSVSRLREKNKELKLAMTTAQDHADTLEAQLAAAPAAEAPKPPRRSSRKAAQPDTASASEDVLSET